LNAKERKLRARLAAQTRWAHEDGVAGTAKARATFDRRFIDEVDPDRKLDPRERARRAVSARRAYYTRLAFKSARARRARKTAP
jgi:hypothetical protein